MRSLLQILKRGLRWALQPIREEFTFFLTVLFLNASTTIGYFITYITSWPSVRVSLRYFAIAMVISWAFCALLRLVPRNRWRTAVKWTLYALLIFLNAVYAFLWMNFEMKISPNIATLLAETNSRETAEFIKTYFLGTKSYIAYGITFGALLLVGGAHILRHAIDRFASRKWPWRCIAPIITAGLAWGTMHLYTYPALMLCKTSEDIYSWEADCEPWPMDLLSSCLYSVKSLSAASADLERAVHTARIAAKQDNQCTEDDELNVIFVLGESYIKWHASLYGYNLRTTPNLEKERDAGNLFVFTDVIAPYNATSVCEKNAMSLNCLELNEMWYEYPMWATLFKSAGYNVYMWDMQRDYQTHKMYTITVNSFLYNDEIARLTYSDTINHSLCYDGTLIDDFRDSARVALAKHNLVLFHLMGQHVNPGDRYPDLDKFKLFSAKDIKRNDKYLDKEKKEFIAQYDNATYYNDVIMSRIFDMWRDKNTVVVYFSDHGDEAYDFRDAKGRAGHENPDWRQLKFQNDVPFMVWCSDEYIKRHPDIASDLKAATSRPYVITNAGHLLLRLGGIKTKYYNPWHDVSSKQYRPTKRIIYYTYDYDSIRWKEPGTKRKFKSLGNTTTGKK